MNVYTMLWLVVSLRLPSIRAHIRPAVPELTCTTVPRAKSSTFHEAVGVGPIEHAIRPPHPVVDRRVDEDRPQADEPEHCPENFMPPRTSQR